MGWTTRKAAEFLGVTLSFVARLCREGVLTAKMHGRDWDIDPKSVEKYKNTPKNKGGRPKEST